jgi:flavin-dependent dehydrogenase
MIVVVGAGVAGSLAARALALRGRKVLLFEREQFPRDKVCGACVGSEAMRALRSAGLGDLPARLGGTPLKRVDLHAGGRDARLPLEGGMAVSRSALDHALLQEARNAGVSVREGINLEFFDGGVRLPKGDEVHADVVLRATGLGGGDVRRSSLLGAGAVFEADRTNYEPGSIHMAHAFGAYVGVTEAEEGRLIVGAALRPRAVRRFGIEGAVARILRSAGRPPLPPGASWRGTPLLTRRPPRPYAGRTLFVGDSAGYAEPFTGEGMGWAMLAGLAAADHVAAGWRDGLGEAWALRLHELLGRPHRRCRRLARVLRVPGAVSASVRVLRLFPSLAPHLVRTTSAWASPS